MQGLGRECELQTPPGQKGLGSQGEQLLVLLLQMSKLTRRNGGIDRGHTVACRTGTQNQSLDSQTSHIQFTILQNKSHRDLQQLKLSLWCAKIQTFAEIFFCFLTLNTGQFILPTEKSFHREHLPAIHSFVHSFVLQHCAMC